MTKNKTAILMAMTMIVATLVPLAMADMTNYDDEKFATGPVGVLPQEPTGIALAACLEEEDLGSQSPVISCEPNPGTLQSAGGTFFDVPAGNSDGVEVEVNVKRVDGVEGGGFRVDGCSDVDDDTSADYCTHSYAGNGFDCDANGENKDKKNCNDSTDASFVGCAFRDNAVDFLGFEDGAFDDYVVFISAWADTTAVNENDPIVVSVPDPTEPGNLLTVTIFPDPPGKEKDEYEKDHVAASAGTFRVRVDWQDDLDRTDCFYEALGLDKTVGGAPPVFNDWDADESLMGRTQCSDDIDNDGDGEIDWDGGSSGVDISDGDCPTWWDDDESMPGKQ